MSDITVDQLKQILSGDPEELGTHLSLVKKDIAVPGSKTTLHVHCLTIWNEASNNAWIDISKLIRETMEICIPSSLRIVGYENK